ncbi:lysine-rich arabinogalactan protein 19-like [Prunus persica]|uniref:lysine-rich arabinogalactan protein 19-like n=1 Tax=Prunus persica TaxID=3760 RepID=UPI0009ABA50C|nr:lysine-rich arabinogalactan protein 19-like [Prunus persica]
MASFFPRFLKFLPAVSSASYPGGFGPRPRRWWYPRAPPPSPSSQPLRFLRFSPNRLRRVLPPPATNSDNSGMMSDLITRRRAVTTTQSTAPPTQPTSAATAPASPATAPALMDHLAVGPAGSQGPASSASSVAQPVSARRRQRPLQHHRDHIH